MAPQQIQALEILLATLPELEQRINQELTENPTLELLQPGSEEYVGNPVEAESGAAVPATEGEDGGPEDRDGALAALVEQQGMWRDFGGGSGGTVPYTEEDLERRQHMFDSLTAEVGLQDLLLQQLREVDGLDEDLREVCAHIVGSIDESGYLRTHPADIATALQVGMEQVRRGLAIVQGFEPAGVGARDLRECLLLQLERKGARESLEYRLVEAHLEALAKNHIPQIAKALRVSPGHVYELLARIRRLSPFPGSLVSEKGVDFVYPEISIVPDEAGGWQVVSNRRGMPRLRLSPAYLAMLEDPEVSAEDKRYLREKLQAGRMLMRAIDQRQSTIERIGEALVEFQRDFLEYGGEHLRPLVMSQVADRIGVHETTVSRAISGKYVQTPQGLFPLRHFFSSGYRSDAGEQVSSHAIREKLQALIDSEDSGKPYSDQKLVGLLQEQGLTVARRTVAKYREELGIPATHLRRSFRG
ncbi:MAG: RNA polymerase factor sigma-54 [Lentisphaeria bacterium]|nr:RNA polymerase factor sigma-54 [Lentisphaeria bacterium]